MKPTPIFALALLLLIPATRSVQDLSSPVTAQENPPSVGLCRSRVTAWGEEIGEIDKLSWDVISKRVLEMLSCGNADPERRDDYQAAVGIYNAVLLTRTTDFIKRRNLWDEFKLEDGQGKR
jgi:hypothetical protein